MIKNEMTTRELVAEGAKLFADAEKGLKRATDALIQIRKIYPRAYANGAIKGGEAIKSESRAVELAGAVSSIRQELIDFHLAGTRMAQSVGEDVPGAFEELPDVKDDGGVSTKSGGGR